MEKHFSLGASEFVYLNRCSYGPRDCGSIPGWMIPKTQNMVHDASLTLSIIMYVSRVSGAI